MIKYLYLNNVAINLNHIRKIDTVSNTVIFYYNMLDENGKQLIDKASFIDNLEAYKASTAIKSFLSSESKTLYISSK